MRRKPTLRDRDRRRIKNERFKKSSTYKWEWNNATPPSQKNLRWWQRRELHRQKAPHRLASAVMNGLISRHLQSDGSWTASRYAEIALLDPGRPSLNIFDFWISWLHGIHTAARLAIKWRLKGGKTSWDLSKPILDLMNAIEDLKFGVKSEFTAACFTKRKRGDRTDPPAIADHKKMIGLTFRLLREIGFCTQNDAIRYIKKALKSAGMRHGHTLDNVRKWAKLVNDSEFKSFAGLHIEYMLIKYTDYIRSDARPNSGALINRWKSLVEQGRMSLPQHNWRERNKILRAWVAHTRFMAGMWTTPPRIKADLQRFGI